MNNSRGISIGVDDSARSGRIDERNEPNVALNEGGESSEIFWYALVLCQKNHSPYSRQDPLYYCIYGEVGGPTQFVHELLILRFPHAFEVWVQLSRFRLMEVG